MSNQYSAKYAAERKAAEVVLRKGLATVNEVAQFYGLQRQTVAVWARGIDTAAARYARVEAALRAAAPAPSRTRR